MLLDYNRIDPELLPALEALPALDLNRDNIARIRDLIASRPRPSSSVKVLSDRKTNYYLIFTTNFSPQGFPVSQL